MVPHVSGPNEVKTMVSLPEMERKRVPIQKAYLLSCVNARFEDLHDAAEVIRTRGGRVADGVEFYLAPASAETQARAESNGDWQTLIGAGAIPLPPGCGACIGLGRGLVQKARPQSAPRIAISKAAWAIATRSFIWLRPLSSPPARWPDSFARQQISAERPAGISDSAP